MMMKVALVLVASWLVAAQAGAAPLKAGRYYGSCILPAYSSDGKSAACLPKGSVVTNPFYVDLSYDSYTKKYSYLFSQDGASITPYKGGSAYNLPSQTGAIASYTYASVPKSKASCVTATFPNGFVQKFRATTEKVGYNGVWQYVEEGVIVTKTYTPYNKQCPITDYPFYYCNADYFNYRCVGYLYK